MQRCFTACYSLDILFQFFSLLCPIFLPLCCCLAVDVTGLLVIQYLCLPVIESFNFLFLPLFFSLSSFQILLLFICNQWQFPIYYHPFNRFPPLVLSSTVQSRTITIEKHLHSYSHWYPSLSLSLFLSLSYSLCIDYKSYKKI